MSKRPKTLTNANFSHLLQNYHNNFTMAQKPTPFLQTVKFEKYT